MKRTLTAIPTAIEVTTQNTPPAAHQRAIAPAIAAPKTLPPWFQA